MNDFAGNVWDDVPEWGGGVGARRIVRAEGGRLNASVWQFAPGAAQFVYHFHHGSEEMLIVLGGTPTVRMNDGDRVLREGDVVPFPRGPAGGHQVRNDGEETARVLILRRTRTRTWPSTTRASWPRSWTVTIGSSASTMR